MNIGSLPALHARYRGDHPAVVFGDQRLSYREFNARINRLANALLRAGVAKGTHIATILPNSIELLELYWAVAKIGAIVVPSSVLLQETGLRTLLDQSDTEMVFSTSAFANTLSKVRGDTPKINPDRWILTRDQPGDEIPDGFIGYHEFIGDAPSDEPPDPGTDPADIYNIIYSSGTTGDPKGIIHTHQVRSWYCTLFSSAWRMTPESIVMHAGSIVFNGSFLTLLPSMFVGCTYVLLEKFDPDAVINVIEREQITHTIMVPSQIIAMMNSERFVPAKLQSLEMIQTLGATLHLEHKQRLVDALPGRFYELYGLTEGFMTILDKTDVADKLASVGSPARFNECRIFDDADNILPPNTPGEICGRGPLMMPGYYNRPDLTGDTLRGGWLHTGDIGYLDDDGYLYLIDRKKDMVVSGGINVYPRDIEEITVGHPDVIEAAVFGIPDPKWGETCVGAVVLGGDATVSSDDLKSWINHRVEAKFQRLSDLVVLNDFPRNVAGKTLKRDIRAKYLKGR